LFVFQSSFFFTTSYQKKNLKFQNYLFEKKKICRRRQLY
jgi:hypothetical protein